MDQDSAPQNAHNGSSGSESGSGHPEPGGTVCSLCGAVAQGTPPTWTCSVEDGVRLYQCEDCARAHIRSIEGRLDSSWW
ncbi:hypothetical protein [Streptomyces genisteinicus]|uniref:hypothetical protein n=1 Tax=Streptomyces genisteinicus TaxID=2768068 RepID=UPI003CCDCB3B